MIRVQSRRCGRFLSIPCRSESCFPKRCFSARGTTSDSAQQDVIPPTDTETPNIHRKSAKLGHRNVIFSGIQPTGIPHLGNYLGALRQWKRFQDESIRMPEERRHRLLFSVVDLHALTHHQDPNQLRQHRNETLASLMAIGLDAKQSILFFQSEVPEHTKLMWYLSNVASTGYLSRMTQWKSKIGIAESATMEDQAAKDKLKLGLFAYPVLQAADILLYRPDIVPVGEDQEQHVEFTRSLARSFNARYRHTYKGEDIFKVPRALISPAKRVMSLKDPITKMSKSHQDPNSRILITDSPEEIRSKVKGALTDSTDGISFDPEHRPGVSNLVEILKHTSNLSASCSEVAADHANLSMRAFKEHVAEEIIKSLAGIRDRYNELVDPRSHEIQDALSTSRGKVKGIAAGQIARIETVMGLREPMTSKPSTQKRGSRAKKEAVMQEQVTQQDLDEQEPDVVPQKSQGVDIPIAS